MLLLERLSPLERESFLLHDVFGLEFAEVARTLARGEAAISSAWRSPLEPPELSRPRITHTELRRQSSRLVSVF